jgi:hypothetical protein
MIKVETRHVCAHPIAVIFTGITLFFALAASKKVSADDSGTLYDVYEKSFTCTANCPASDEAKSSQTFTATFENGSASMQLPGFWAGGNVWKFRFAPTLIGTWTWNVATTPQMTFAEGATGTVDVSQSNNSGFLRRSTVRPYTFAYSDGTPVFVWGNTGYAILDTALHGGTAEWQTFVDQTKAHGMNKIRMLVTLWNFGGIYAGPDRAPWQNCTRANPSFAAFDQSYWEVLDEVVDYMQAKGVIAELILFPDYSSTSASEPGLYQMTQADEQRYMSFAIARYAGYSNVIWCLTNEWGNSWRGRLPSQGPPPGNNQYSGNCLSHPEWISGGGTEEGLGPYMMENDPYVIANGRLLSSHQKGTEAVNGQLAPNHVFDFWNDTWRTHGVIQMVNYDPAMQMGHDWGNYAIMQNRGHNAPICNDEYGYDNGTTITRETSRKAAWGIAVAGGYGSYAEWHGTMPYLGSMLGSWRPYPSQDDIAVLINFMKSTNFRNMAPHNELVTLAPSPAYMYANPGHDYVMYTADGGWNSNYTITLKAGPYDAWWYSTTTGSVVKTEAPFQLAADGSKTLTAPDFSADTDVVLEIRHRDFSTRGK